MTSPPCGFVRMRLMSPGMYCELIDDWLLISFIRSKSQPNIWSLFWLLQPSTQQKVFYEKICSSWPHLNKFRRGSKSNETRQDEKCDCRHCNLTSRSFLVVRIDILVCERNVCVCVCVYYSKTKTCTLPGTRVHSCVLREAKTLQAAKRAARKLAESVRHL